MALIISGCAPSRYCQRCADTFSNHVMRELLANQVCTRTTRTILEQDGPNRLAL